jgi:hypothetical protein
VKGAFLKGKFSSSDEVLLLEVPQGFRWVYNKLGDEMEMKQKAGDDMQHEAVMERAKEIFKEWTAKSPGDKIKLLKQQMSIKQGSKKVYLKMQRTIYGCVQDFEFVISGMSDSNFNQCPDTRKSVSGNTTIVNGVPVVTKSVMQDTMKLSVTEAELESATTNVQDMLFLKQILESILLKVKLPMVLYTDSRSVIDLINNWSVGGRLRHVATKTMFLRELKELGWLVLEHTPGSLMRTDLMTKNLLKPVYEQHSSFYVTDEEFDQVEQQQARESVGIEDSERHAGGASESVERKECHDERDGAHDPGIKRLQQLDVGDMEPDRRDRLKIGVEDSNIGGAIIQRGIERDRRGRYGWAEV